MYFLCVVNLTSEVKFSKKKKKGKKKLALLCVRQCAIIFRRASYLHSDSKYRTIGLLIIIRKRNLKSKVPNLV